MSEDLVTRFEESDLPTCTFNFTGKNTAKDIDPWLRQTKDKSDCKRVGFSQSYITGINCCSLYSKKNFIVLGYWLRHFLQLKNFRRTILSIDNCPHYWFCLIIRLIIIRVI